MSKIDACIPTILCTTTGSSWRMLFLYIKNALNLEINRFRNQET